MIITLTQTFDINEMINNKDDVLFLSYDEKKKKKNLTRLYISDLHGRFFQ